MAAFSVILAGPPATVSGVVPFHNDSDSDVTVGEFLVRDPDTGEATLPIDPVTVPPGRSVSISIHLSLEPQTPPGDYELEVTIAGTALDAVAHVTESRDLSLRPGTVVIDNVPGPSGSRHVVVMNQGNVPAFVADFGTVPLYREDAAIATLLAMSRAPALGAPSGVEPLPEPDLFLEVATSGGRAVIAPGEAQVVELIVTVPDALPQSARYLAALPIGVHTLLVAVVPAGAAPQDSSR